MGARQKLNVANFNGCLLLSAIFGAATESWLVFFLVMLVFVGFAYHQRSIRI